MTDKTTLTQFESTDPDSDTEPHETHGETADAPATAEIDANTDIDANRDSNTGDGNSLSAGTEFRVTDRDMPHTEKGLYIRVEEIYEMNGEQYVVFSTTGMGPELDLHVDEFTPLIGTTLKRDEFDPHTHDPVTPPRGFLDDPL